MFKFSTLLGLSLGLVSTAFGQTYWLNIPGAYSKTEAQYMPSISLPTANQDSCADAIVEYAKDNLVYYISCDVHPLRDAANLKAGRR